MGLSCAKRVRKDARCRAMPVREREIGRGRCMGTAPWLGRARNGRCLSGSDGWSGWNGTGHHRITWAAQQPAGDRHCLRQAVSPGPGFGSWEREGEETPGARTAGASQAASHQVTAGSGAGWRTGPARARGAGPCCGWLGRQAPQPSRTSRRWACGCRLRLAALDQNSSTAIRSTVAPLVRTEADSACAWGSSASA